MGLCGPGVERVAERIGFSLEQFLLEGYPCALAEMSSNPMLLKAARLARDEWEAANGQG